MQRHGVQIVDLHRILVKRGAPKLLADGVHYTEKGYTELAGDIAPPMLESLDRARKHPH